MRELKEFEVVAYKREDITEDDKKLQDLGLYTSVNEEDNEIVAKYAFDINSVWEVRESYVKYKGNWLPAVVCSFSENNCETPPLLISYEDFKTLLNENNKNITIK